MAGTDSTGIATASDDVTNGATGSVMKPGALLESPTPLSVIEYVNVFPSLLNVAPGTTNHVEIKAPRVAGPYL